MSEQKIDPQELMAQRYFRICQLFFELYSLTLGVSKDEETAFIEYVKAKIAEKSPQK